MKKIIYILLIASVFASCNQGDNKAKELSDKNKAGMQKFYDEVMNKHNPAMIDSLLVADYTAHESDPSMQTKTREEFKKMMVDFFAAMPDLNYKINFMVADSDMVVAHYTFTGTNSGSMMGLPATNKKVNIDGVDIVRFKAGKGSEHWGYNDEIKMMTQLGMKLDMSAMMPDTSKKKMDDKMTKDDSKPEKKK